MSNLVTADELQAMLGDPRLRLFDASWYMPADGRDAEAEFLAGHIAGAQRFDFDRVVCDPDTSLPHMLPDERSFTAHARALGIDNDSRVVFYDTHGLFAAPRAWWMCRAMGHADCRVLQGGLPGWLAAGFAVGTGSPPPRRAGTFTAALQRDWLADRGDVLAAIDSPDVCIVDARPAGRFSGELAEPRPGLRRGHIPSSRNLPATSLVDDGRLRPPGALRDTLAALVPTDSRLIASCGSGVTASLVALAAREAGYTQVAVYDGSWAEWGGDPRLPLATGPA